MAGPLLDPWVITTNEDAHWSVTCEHSGVLAGEPPTLGAAAREPLTPAPGCALW